MVLTSPNLMTSVFGLGLEVLLLSDILLNKHVNVVSAKCFF